MDSKAILSYAVLQLTPTRTRCDLVVCLGDRNEKLASGLVEPFISHLKFAKDQIQKGGYSITLYPPSIHAYCFTKATIQRFVRFVSTPEILERFVRIEKEILQIQSSVQSNESSNGNIAGQADKGSFLAGNAVLKKSNDSCKFIDEVEVIDDAVHEENSKICLQRLLETRKALLRKEQAMVYARALAAGFEMDYIDNLISFADAFGASRLRGACIDFRELSKRKHTDGLWMDELASMEACFPPELSYSGPSGIVLTCESDATSQNNIFSTGKVMPNGSVNASSDSNTSLENSNGNKDKHFPASDQIPPTSAKVQMKMPFSNQIPQYMYNFHRPVQQMPPFRGYPFPGMRPVPPYYQGNMCWPPNMDVPSHGHPREPDYRQHQKSSTRKKEKSSSVKEPVASEEDEQTESSDSDSGSHSDGHPQDDRKHSSKEQPYRKKHRKKSSKTVVIRNINYITSKSRNGETVGVPGDPSSVEDELIDQDSIKQKIEDAVGSLEKHHESASHGNRRRGGHKSPRDLNRSDGSADRDSENDQVADTSGRRKGNENWDAFQNLLVRDEDSTANEVEKDHPINFQDEHFRTERSDESIAVVSIHALDLELEKTLAVDSFAVVERDGGQEVRLNLEDFGNREDLRSSMKRIDCADEQMLLLQGMEKSGSSLEGTLSHCTMESPIIKNGKGEDWFIVNHSRKSENQEAACQQATCGDHFALSLEGDRSQTGSCKKIVPIDDSFMVKSLSAVDDQFDSQWKTDMSMIADLNVASQPNSASPDVIQEKPGLSSTCEPDDICMMLVRNSGWESAGAYRTPEVDYGIEISFTEAKKKSSAIETNDHMVEKVPVKIKSTNGKNALGLGSNNSGKEARSKVFRGSLAKSNSDILSKIKKPSPTSRPMVRKSKVEKEADIRRKTEELLIQRQKRIAERTAASVFTPAASKKDPVGSKTAFSKYDKHRPQSRTQ
ncbi:COP1-interacting protein 7-like [Cornus florida]|uniref:COP1-interacting protein 7-like n=1 Tax=Cornus florida TaxID=4283 RepID=UPI00289B3D57|nr:COP1-interacting protein 7-like [Cornus florida]